MENNNQNLSVEKVKSEIGLSLTKLAGNYQTVLQAVSDIKFDKENLQQDYKPLKELRSLIKNIEDIVDEGKKPHYDNYKKWLDAGKDFIAPLKSLLDTKTEEYKKEAEELRKQQDQEAKETERINTIKNSVVEFVNKATKAIAIASTDSEIVLLQKLVGSEKARTTFYQEFLPELKTSCDALTPLIEERKKGIKKIAKLRSDEEKAEKDGDIQKLTDIKEEIEGLNDNLNENILRMQEKAFEQTSNIETVVGHSLGQTVKPRWSSWDWRVDDIELLRKKMPQLTEIIPIEAEINKLLAIKKVDGSLKGVEELKYFGITFFLDKKY